MFLGIVLMLLSLAIPTSGTPVMTGRAIDTHVCKILEYPDALVGTLVRVRGRVVSEIGVLYMRDSSCFKTIRLTLPHPLPSVLKQSKGFKQLEHYVNAPAEPHHGEKCLVCNRYNVTATIVGLVQCAATKVKDGKPQKSTPAQCQVAGEPHIIVQSITGVSAQDVNGVAVVSRNAQP